MMKVELMAKDMLLKNDPFNSSQLAKMKKSIPHMSLP